MWTFLLLNFALTLIAESQSSLQPTQGLAKQSRDCLWSGTSFPFTRWPSAVRQSGPRSYASRR